MPKINEKVSFSERMGLLNPHKELQMAEMDDDLSNSLWNLIHEYVLEYERSSVSNESMLDFRTDLMSNFLKKPIHDLQYNAFNYEQPYYNIFLELPWNKVYDLMQFLLYKPYVKYGYYTRLNEILEREFSGYRVINGAIVPISNELEINAINEALVVAKKFTALDGVNVHLTNALTLLSDRDNMDFRNSIKESISAVETAAKLITGETTLGNALNKIEKTGIQINNQLKESFNKIYNYTNDKNAGIRHGVAGEHIVPDFETAKYIVITSSAFVNYLIGLAEKSGVLKSNKKANHKKHSSV